MSDKPLFDSFELSDVPEVKLTQSDVMCQPGTPERGPDKGQPVLIAPNPLPCTVIFKRRLRLALLTCAGALLLQGCGVLIPPPFGEVDGFGRGAVISDKELDEAARPPKQIIYRYDEHRYIESDPSPGFIGGCQGESYYVDESLGIRTLFGLSQEDTSGLRIPKGVFKVEGKAPFVVARDQTHLFISFDQGRSFKHLVGWSSQDIAVIGEDFYFGSGGGATSFRFAFRSSEIEKYRYNAKAVERAELFELIAKSKEYFEDQASWERLRAEIGVVDERYKFKCNDNLPWRPSLKYERQHPTPKNK